jgi:hypothetical protein
VVGEKTAGIEVSIDGVNYTGEIGAEVFNYPSSNIAVGAYSHAEGNSTVAIGDYSHTEGSRTKAVGTAGSARGLNS